MLQVRAERIIIGTKVEKLRQEEPGAKVCKMACKMREYAEKNEQSRQDGEPCKAS